MWKCLRHTSTKASGLYDQSSFVKTILAKAAYSARYACKTVERTSSVSTLEERDVPERRAPPMLPSATSAISCPRGVLFSPAHRRPCNGWPHSKPLTDTEEPLNTPRVSVIRSLPKCFPESLPKTTLKRKPPFARTGEHDLHSVVLPGPTSDRIKPVAAFVPA